MKLRDLYQTLSTDERKELAKKVETKPGYLWQLATGWRGKKPSIDLIRKLADADTRMTAVELLEEFSGESAPTAAA